MHDAALQRAATPSEPPALDVEQCQWIMDKRPHHRCLRKTRYWVVTPDERDGMFVCGVHAEVARRGGAIIRTKGAPVYLATLPTPASAEERDD